MKVREWCVKHLTDNGLWPNEAEEVVSDVQDDKANEALTAVFADETEGYPIQFLSLAQSILDHAAVRWIDENKPNRFARPMFLPQTEREALFRKEGVLV